MSLMTLSAAVVTLLALLGLAARDIVVAWKLELEDEAKFHLLKAEGAAARMRLRRANQLTTAALLAMAGFAVARYAFDMPLTF